jgi:hypothetical protein
VDEVLREHEAFMTQIGLGMAQSLVSQISGGAARSELDAICKPLKKMIEKRVEARPWLVHAMNSHCLSPNVTMAEKGAFLEKILRLVPFLC